MVELHIKSISLKLGTDTLHYEARKNAYGMTDVDRFSVRFHLDAKNYTDLGSPDVKVVNTQHSSVDQVISKPSP